MNDNQEKITPLQNSEEHQKLIDKYETEIETHKQQTLDWKNAAIKKDDTLLEKKKEIERLEKERDDWKREAHAQRKIQSESQQVKETTDFLTHFKKLQEKKGLKYDEETNQWINNTK